MRIIKDTTDRAKLLRIICGEMLNIETSTLHYIDGERTFVGNVVPDKYRGYPRVENGVIMDIIRSTCGYIFVAPGTNRAEFEEELIDCITAMEFELSEFDVLHTAHTVQYGFCTNVLVKSSLKLTKGGSDSPVKTYKSPLGNTRRQFTRSTTDERRGRFSWMIRSINEIVYQITSANIEDSISQHISSIFYDSDDICILGHNAITFTLAPESFIGHGNLVDLEVRIFKHGHPLLIDRSTFWTNKHVPKLRNIDSGRVYSTTLEQILLGSGGQSANGKKIPRTAKNKMPHNDNLSAEICHECNSILWGENYIVPIESSSFETVLFEAICPICMHLVSNECEESTYPRIFRATFTRSIKDMLEAPDQEHRRDLLEAVMSGYEEKELFLGTKLINYILIGEKYVSFDKSSRFLYTKISKMPEFAGKKVCHAAIIKY